MVWRSPIFLEKLRKMKHFEYFCSQKSLSKCQTLKSWVYVHFFTILKRIILEIMMNCMQKCIDTFRVYNLLKLQKLNLFAVLNMCQKNLKYLQKTYPKTHNYYSTYVPIPTTVYQHRHKTRHTDRCVVQRLKGQSLGLPPTLQII